MVQGGMTCIKYLMFVFNFVFVVCGIVLIAIGAAVQSKELTMFLQSKYVTAPTILIVVGCLIFILAFLGCCGAVKENHCMVTLFGILLFVVFIIEVAGGISAYVYRGEIEGFLKDNMNDTINQNKSDGNAIWNEMQQKLHCCGVDSSQDYLKNNRTIPSSCCKDVDADQCNVENPKNIFPDGCFDEIYTKVKKYIGMVGGAAVGIAVVELIGCMFAWCLAAAIKKEYEGV